MTKEVAVAHIRRHPNAKGRWQVRYVDPSGKERAKNFPRKSDAEKFLVTIETDKLRGDWVDPRLAKITLEEWTGRWWGATSHLKVYTRDGYRSLLRVHVFPRFAQASLGSIQPVDIREWISDLDRSGLSASRIRQAYFLLGQILRSAAESGYLAKSPCVGVKLPRMQVPEMRFLTVDQVEVLATTISSPYGALINTLAYGGLRWGEVAALRRGRCELLRSRLHVVESLSETSEGLLFGPTKTYQRRTVVIPGFLRDLLAEHLVTEVEPEDDALVFSSPGAEPLRRGNFSRRLWRPALEAAGLVLRPHDLRHTCAALLVAEGAHPKAVQVHLGHSSIQVTMDRYGHLFPSDAEDLADRLDATHRQALTDTKGAASRSEVLQLPVA
jgi:integrase